MILPEVTDKSEVNVSKDDALTITSPQEAKPGITSQYNFLREDPSSYFYQKFKQSGSMYLKDKMWAEASKKGQTDLLAYYINENEKYDKELSDQKKTDERHIDTIAKMNEYADEMDYDGYITALANITLDDSDKSRKERISDNGQYSFGTFTDREWNEKILDAQYQRYEAVRLEEYKANRSFWEKAALFLPNLFVTVAGELTQGIMNFVNDIYNIGEGLVNMCVNWTGDDDVGSRFLAAFQDDDWLQQACDGLNDAIIDYEKNYSITGLVDAVKAYDDPESKGLTGWGQAWNGLFESIGYIIPSIVLTQGIGAAAGTGSAGAGAAYKGVMQTYKTAGKAALYGAKQAAINKAIGTASRAIFYAGVFSGNIKETVGGYKAQVAQQGKDATYAYRDLSATDVVVNAGAKAVGQMLVEDALAWVLDASITDRLMYGNAASTQKIIKQTIPNVGAKGIKAAGIAVGRGLKASLKEGLEESLQDLSDGIIDLAYSKLNGGTNLDEVFSASAAEKFNLKNLLQSFVMGAAMDITVGSVKNLKYISPENRQAYEGNDGKVYKMGAFQTMNFNAALETMQQWNSIISDRSANAQDRADAAYRMAITIDTLTPLFRTMTNSDIVMANQMLNALAKDNKTKESVKALYSENDFSFGKRLLDTLMYSAAQYNETWTEQKAQAKLAKINAKKDAISKSLGNKKEYLQDKNVTQVTNVVTTEMTDAEIEEAGLPKTTKEFMEKSGADTLVTVDGTGAAIQDGKTVILDSKLAKQGDIPTILRTEAHETVVEDVAKSLPSDFKKFLLKVFRGMTGDKKSTYKQAIKALLFDGNFFAEMLVQSNGQMSFQKVLTHLDSIYKSSLLKASQEADTLTSKAVKALLTKVRENMKQALFKYCTQYVLVDLDEVSTTILSKEDKKAIKEYASVQLAEQYANLKAEAKKGPVEIYDKKAFYYVGRALNIIEKNTGVLTKMGLTPDEVIKKLQSPNRNTRTDALALIETLFNNIKINSGNKLLLATTSRGLLNYNELQQINTIYSHLGINNLDDLRANNIDWNNVTDDVKSVIVSNGYNVNNTNDRSKIADRIIYQETNGKFAVTSEFVLVRVLDANTYMLDMYKPSEYENYQTANFVLSQRFGNKPFTLRDILDPDTYLTESQWKQKSTFLPVEARGITKPILSDAFLNRQVIFDNNLPRNVAGQARGNILALNPNSGAFFVEIICHEATHGTQSDIFYTKGFTRRNLNGTSDVYSYGSAPSEFTDMSYESAKEIVEYLQKNFPLIYSYYMQLDPTQMQYDFTDVIYSLLEGELQANLYLGLVLDTLGFRYKVENGNKQLVSPDDNKWDISSIQSEYAYALPSGIDDTYTLKLKLGDKYYPVGRSSGTPVYTTEDKIMRYGLNNESTIGKMPTLTKASSEVFKELTALKNKYEKDSRATINDNSSLSNIATQTQLFNKLLNHPTEISENAMKFMSNFIKQFNTVMDWVDNVYTQMIDANNANKLDAAYTISNKTLPNRTMPSEIINDKKWTKSGKDYTPYGISAKKGEYTDRTIKPNEGKGTKLDNWRKAGKTQINPAIKRFVIGTTADFKKLPDFLRKKIDNASLTLRDINYFIKTSANMNEYTFKAIAELVYQNTDLAQLSLKQYNKLRNELSVKYAILGTLVHELEKKDKLNLLDDYIDDPHRKMTIEEMDELWTKLRKVKEGDLAAAMEAASTLSTMLRIQTKNSKFIDEAVVDPTVLHLPFFMHYDGTLDSLAHINDLGKQIDVNNKPITIKKAETLSSDIDTSAVSGEGEGHHGEGRKGKSDTPWNWRWFAENDAGKIDYNYDEAALNKDLIRSSEENLQDTLDSIDRDDKVEAIMNYLTDEIVTKVEQMSPAEKIKNAPKLLQQLDDKRAELYDASIDKIDKLYLKTLSTESKLETESQTTQEGDDTKLLAEGNIKRSKKRLQTSVNTFEKRIIRPSRFEKLPDEIKQYFDPVYTKGGRIKGYKNNIFIAEMSKNGKYVRKWNLNEKYANMTPEQLDKISTTIQEGSRILGKVANQANIEKMAKQKAKEMLKEREGILTKQTTDKKPNPKAPMKEKVAVTYKTQVINQKFYVTSTRKPTDLTNSLLSTNWSEKSRMSTVQGVTGNVEKDVANGATFFSQNSEALLRATAIDGEIENTCRWFLDTRLNNATDADFQKFQAIKLYFLGWVLENAQKNSDFANLPNSLIQEIEHALKSKATENATGLAIWNNIRKRLNPAEAMSKAAMIIDGVEIPDDLKGDLFQTVETGNVADMAAMQDKIIQYVEEHRTGKKSIFRKMVSVRSASMLSSPLTWLRNKVSNIALKRLNILSDKIGAKIMPKRTVEGQLRMDDKLKVTFGKDGKVLIGSKTVRPEVTKAIQDFVNTNFIDNGMFDTFCKNLSRYNPSEISDAARAYAVDKITGEPRKEYIMSQLVLKAMYNEYYNKNMFKSKGMQKVYSFLMQAMSDDSYVRETSIRYFGQILAEKGTDLSQGMTDGIMNDFAKAMGLALRDYMHSDNLFNKFEKMLLDKNEAYWLTYKLLLPYAGSAWNWFKGMMNYTPIGLIDGIRKFWKLENTVMKNEAKWMKGQTDIPGELTEFFVRRQIGSGVLGTIGTIIGALLAGLGLVRLDDDDYGTPKIKIGNISVDVSSIFGSSSILTGASFVNGIMKKDMWTALGQAFDYTLDSFPLMDIIHSDMYSESIIDTIANRGESIALSFIPNFLSYVAGATYTGNIKKTTFWDKLGAKLPFVGNFLPKKVNPYTGDKGGVIDLINRIVPYFSYDAASVNESKSEELGLNKKQLRGDYDINGKSFKVTGKELETINVKYGQLNAKDLGQFYTNSLKVRIKTPTGYQELTYNQMTEGQRKSAVNSIMSENAKVVKIMAWTSAGHKYYASLDLYNKLRANGITKNIYRGTKGYSD